MSNPPATSLLPLGQGPRVIVYHQTLHGPDGGPPVSLLPLITNQTGITHVIIAAIHLNDPPGHITLNNDPPDAAKHQTLWSEVAWLQASGVKVLGMLGGAAQGSFARLDGDNVARFESHYCPLRDMVRRHRLDGLDLDIEEPVSLPGTIRLIDRLRADFGPSFLITLAPVATALLPNQPHLSGPGFDYRLLEQMRGHEIAWYNTQFYNGWGDASSTAWFDAIVGLGWRQDKVVMGLLTNPCHGGSGYVACEQMEGTLRTLRQRYSNFAGVMGWEYWRSLPGTEDRPWDWVSRMSRVLRTPLPPSSFTAQQGRPPQMPTRPYGGSVDNLPPPQPPFPAESITTLQELGFSQQQVIAALNSTSGNVEHAASLLFQD